jgi:hypothetical protein
LGIFIEFQKIMNTVIPNNADPSLALKTIANGFAKMEELQCEVLHKIQVLLYLSKLTAGKGFKMITQTITSTDNLNKVDIRETQKLTRLLWEQKSSSKPPAPQANKISTIRRAPGEPSFSGQQENQGQSGEWKKRPRRAGKKKQAAKAATEVANQGSCGQ